MPRWPSTGRCTRRRWAGKKAGPNPTNRGKAGVKRRLLTEARGIPVGLVPEGTSRQAIKLTERALRSLPPAAEAGRAAHRAADHDPHRCLDAGYDYAQEREVVAELGYRVHIQPRGEAAQAKQAGPQAWRWVVERTHSWLNRFRHRLTRWVQKPKSSKATWPCATLLAPELPGIIAYVDSLLVANTTNIAINLNIPRPFLYSAITSSYHLVGITLTYLILAALKQVFCAR